MNKKIFTIIVASLLILSGIIYYMMSDNANKASSESKIILTDISMSKDIDINDKAIELAKEAKEAKEDDIVTILVHICGEVESPGVYSFALGARIIEGIEAAGGFLKTADIGYLNLASKMEDEQKVYVPTKEEVEAFNLSLTDYNNNLTKEDTQGLININTASVEKLMELPGIGVKKAEKIIKYREVNGLFKSIEDIINVDGISEALYKKISTDITI